MSRKEPNPPPLMQRSPPPPPPPQTRTEGVECISQLRSDLEEARRDLAEANTTADIAVDLLNRVSAYRKHFPDELRRDLCGFLMDNMPWGIEHRNLNQGTGA